MADPAPPVDTSVKLPRGVVASAARADEIHKAAYPGEQPPPAPDTPPAGEVTTPPAAAPPLATPQAPPAAPSAATPPAATPPLPLAPPPETQDDWKARYLSLKGRYDQMADRVNNQQTRLNNMETMIATMQRPPPAAAPAPPPPQTKRVTDKEVEEFGADLIEVIQKAALDAVAPVLDGAVNGVRNDFKKELTNLQPKLTAVEREAATSQHARLLAYLDANVENWRPINRHAKFHAWLALTDPMSGVTRKRLLDDAVAQGNGARVSTFYRAFLAEEGVPAPATTDQLPPPAANGGGNGTGKVDLAALAAPGKPAASGIPPAQGGTPGQSTEIITRAQISQFYADKQRGKYSPAEIADLEAQIFAAGREGRVR